jgi:hypothetical protein
VLDRQRLRRMVGSQASGRQQLHRTCRGNMTQRQEASERRQHRALERRRPRSKPRSGAGTPTARRSVAVAYGCQQCILHWLLARTKHERTATPRSPALHSIQRRRHPACLPHCLTAVVHSFPPECFLLDGQSRTVDRAVHAPRPRRPREGPTDARSSPTQRWRAGTRGELENGWGDCLFAGTRFRLCLRPLS